MKTKIENLLKEAAIRTFENICFMFVEPDLEDTQKNLALEAAAEVKFRGNYSGKLIIESRGGLSLAIAVNMLSNNHPGSQQKKDALGRRKELGYKIESPVFLKKIELMKMKEEKKKPLAEVTLNFNEGRADIKFFVDDYPFQEK